MQLLSHWKNTGCSHHSAAEHPLCLQPLPCISFPSLSVQGLAEASCFVGRLKRRDPHGSDHEADFIEHPAGLYPFQALTAVSISLINIA